MHNLYKTILKHLNFNSRIYYSKKKIMQAPKLQLF